MNKKILSTLILLIFVSIASAESDLDSVSFATYYPAPYGVYHEMRTDQQSIGSGYRNNTVPTNSLIVEGNIGIGNPTPNSTKGTGGYLDAKDVYLRDTGKWASENVGISYTVYCCTNSSLCTPLCPASVNIGTQGPCDSGFIVTKSLGQWGYCTSCTRNDCSLFGASSFLPYGVTGGASWDYGCYTEGNAYVCSK